MVLWFESRALCIQGKRSELHTQPSMVAGFLQAKEEARNCTVLVKASHAVSLG
jgi:hypothetical protein